MGLYMWSVCSVYDDWASLLGATSMSKDAGYDNGYAAGCVLGECESD